ncbi:MAG: cobalamin B12-binding domain-containing protein [Chloroflexi bacterium]|nr:cobalamin B12-binding domain-containing protein [Chloroflexota bacterium]
MFEVAGWKVYEFGEDALLDKFVEQQLDAGVEIVALSAFVRTSMLDIREVIKKLKERNDECRVMVGGTLLTPITAQKYAVDGWTESGGTVFDETIRLLTMLGEEELK